MKTPTQNRPVARILKTTIPFWMMCRCFMGLNLMMTENSLPQLN